jgi:hypothetical protein
MRNYLITSCVKNFYLKVHHLFRNPYQNQTWDVAVVFSLRVELVVFVVFVLLTIIVLHLNFQARITHRNLNLPDLIVLRLNNPLLRSSVIFEFFILRQQSFLWGFYFLSKYEDVTNIIDGQLTWNWDVRLIFAIKLYTIFSLYHFTCSCSVRL